ncbi:MAG: hypothetical protein IPN53_08640 [Comamonadaceae bacterium]|nr:hypothetical protein [Comamonadaceae bacterium]
MEEDRRVDPDDPEVPANVRATVLQHWQPGDSLWRCPRLGGRKSWFSTERKIVIEWWLFDVKGNLIDIYWMKP